MNRLEELEAFVAVVDYQGFSRAGEKLGVADVEPTRYRAGAQAGCAITAAND
jgi:hypothetical protein